MCLGITLHQSWSPAGNWMTSALTGIIKLEGYNNLTVHCVKPYDHVFYIKHQFHLFSHKPVMFDFSLRYFSFNFLFQGLLHEIHEIKFVGFSNVHHELNYVLSLGFPAADNQALRSSLFLFLLSTKPFWPLFSLNF